MGDYKRITVMGDSSKTLFFKRRRIGDSRQSLVFSTEPMPIHELGSFGLSLDIPPKVGGIVNLVGDSCSSICFDYDSPVSCCSSNESSDVLLMDGLQIVDLEDKNSETLNSMFIGNTHIWFPGETTPFGEMCEDSEIMEAQAMIHGPRRLRLAKVPPTDEIEEFFATEEKYQQKRFADKYNFDIANGVPLEGRYQWVRLNP